MVRTKTLMMSAALIVLPLMSASAIAAEQAPVIFGTDPGEAHPKYIEQQTMTAGSQSTAEISNGQIVGQPAQVVGQVIRPIDDYSTPAIAKAPDSGSFDYGYASNEVELGRQTGFNGSAANAPTTLLTYSDVQGLSDAQTVAVSNAAYQPEATPYQRDPIYQITDKAPQPVQVAQYATQQPVYQLSSTETAAGDYVRVQPGDTVYGLARRHGVEPNAIIAANNMYAPYELSVGQTLRVPGKKPAPTVYQTQYSQPQYQVTAPAPRPQYQQAPRATGRVYVVQQGNTLYSISRQFGLDVASIARANGMAAPYTLNIGQRIIIPAGGAAAIATAPRQRIIQAPQPAPANRNTYIEPAAAPYTQPAPYQREAATAPVADPAKNVSYGTTESIGQSRFGWPIQGKVVMGYGLGSDGRRNDGINIAAPVGTPIRSVDDGEVVYRGSDLEGYGNLLLVKHSDGWVSAYAHTDAMLVRKGERVSKGQVIAKVGTTGTVAQPQLHFELRHDLKPTDPLAALEGRNKDAIR